jgi:hypothetical protein
VSIVKYHLLYEYSHKVGNIDIHWIASRKGESAANEGRDMVQLAQSVVRTTVIVGHWIEIEGAPFLSLSDS